MNQRRCGILAALIALGLGGCAGGPAAAPGGWVSLFDGRTLEGWAQRGGKAEYRAERGTILGVTRPDQPNSFLCTERHYSDFELEFEFKLDPRVNSGVQFRSNSLAAYQDGRVHGYQVELDPGERAWTGGIYDEGRRGWIGSLENNPAARAAFKQGEWNHVRLVARGDSIRTWVNGVAAADLNDSMTASGFIALQVHGVGALAEPLEVRWRNLRLRELH